MKQLDELKKSIKPEDNFYNMIMVMFGLAFGKPRSAFL